MASPLPSNALSYLVAGLHSSDQSDRWLWLATVAWLCVAFLKKLILFQLSCHRVLQPPCGPHPHSLNALPPFKWMGGLAFSPQRLIWCEFSLTVCQIVKCETLSDKMSSNLWQAQHASRSDKTGAGLFWSLSDRAQSACLHMFISHLHTH